jgi:nucleoside-diphosphate-sugar epimerase
MEWLISHGGAAMKIFLAGATGVIAQRLVPQLVGAGHRVVGTTRSPNKADTLRATGVEPILLDVYDSGLLTGAVLAARPDIVIHQLTDLPPALDPSQMAEGTRRNARMRREGTQNLVSAILASGARRLIAQSIAWMYAPGPQPHSEEDALDIHAQGPRAITVAGVVALERLTTASPPIEGIVLRYGHLYGPNTGSDAAGEAPSLHVDAAASAALLAVEKARRGIFNIAEPNAYLSIEKARRELGFDPSFRCPPSALMRQVGWVEEGRISGSS